MRVTDLKGGDASTHGHYSVPAGVRTVGAVQLTSHSSKTAEPGYLRQTLRRSYFTRSDRVPHGCEPWPGLIPIPQPAGND